MARRKKNFSVQEEVNHEVKMSDQEQLESLESELDLARQELEKTKLEIEEKKQSLKSLDNREYSKKEIEISEKQVATQMKNAGAHEKIEAERIRDSRLVRGDFINRRAQGMPAKLTYCKYPTDIPKWWNFEDGKEYTIPLGFADQINGGSENDPCYYTPKFTQKQDETSGGSAIHSIDTTTKKYAFVIREYL